MIDYLNSLLFLGLSFLSSYFWVRTFSQRDLPVHSARSAPHSTWANPVAPSFCANQRPPPPPAQFAYPSRINDPVTARIRQYSLEHQADASGPWSSIPESFEQLRSDLNNHKFLTTLGKYAVDDPSKLDRLALANLRENKRARNNLASLHAARSCLYGARGLGDKKWFTDKPGIATRLKTQTERRQFRLGLVANVAFSNRLNLADLTSWLAAGTSLDVAAVRPETMLSLSQIRELVQRLSPLDLLRWLTPDKAATLSEAISDISAQVDYGQSLCNHLAASEALEPAHAVLGTLLRTGANFKAALRNNPIQLAAQAVAPLCTGADIDGVLSKAKSNTPFWRGKPRTPTSTNTSAPYPAGVCFDFQKGVCFRGICKYNHRCASCRSGSHGQVACPSTSNA